MIITIDGPSGTGKSTVAKLVAEKLGITFFDTGAMYRSVCWAMDKEGISPDDEKAVEAFLAIFTFDIRIQDGEKRYFVGEIDISKEIRTQKINELVSKVSALKAVREAMWKLQRAYAEKQSAVFEGRDMGSAVFPDAEVKIYLDASPKVRAKRRLEEMKKQLPKEAARFNEKEMKKELMRRDKYDKSRALAPLKCPKRALKINTSRLTIEEVVETILSQHKKMVDKLLPNFLSSRKMGFLYRLVIFFTWVIFKLLYRHKVYGLEHYVKRAGIIAPNHTSYLDPPMVAISWPVAVHFLGKKDLFKTYLFGKFIRALNTHPVSGDVADVTVFKTVIEVLKDGKHLVLFPEGGRTDGEIGPIKPGIGMLVMRSKTAIIPTYLYGANEIYGRNKKFPKLYGKTACVFGTPIVWESFSHLEKKQAQIEIATCLSNALHALKAWFENGAEGIPP